MKRHRRPLRALASLVAVVAGLGLTGGTLARKHVRTVTAGREQGLVSCLRCHLGSTSARDRLPRASGYPSPIDLALDAAGERLFVCEQGADEIAVVSTRDLAVVRHLPVGRDPAGIAVAPDGARAFVSLRAEDRVVAIDTATGAQLGSVPVGLEPRDVLLTPDGSTLLVANSGSDDVSLIDVASFGERARLPAGREPYTIDCAADGSRAWIANLLSFEGGPGVAPAGEVTVLDLERDRVLERAAIDSGHLSQGVAVVEDGAAVLVPLVRVRNAVPITQVAQGWVMTSALGVLLAGRRDVVQLPLDEVNAYYADPAEVALDPGTGRAFVSSGGGDVITVVDARAAVALARTAPAGAPGPWADDLGAFDRYVLARIPVRSNPRALVVDARAQRLYVAERLADSIAVIDTERLEVIGRVPLAFRQKKSEARKGEILFHSAAITFQGQFACRSCHPEGHVDGLTYDFAIDGLGQNLLDNRTLQGIADTAPFKWNGKNPDLATQCGPRFAKVLTLSDPFTPLELERLVAYIESLPPARALPGRPEVVARGKQIFERTTRNTGEEIPVDDRCTTCHRPPLVTNRLMSSVGTRAATDSGDLLDTPHLAGIARSAPYLHDGRARTLEEIWTVHSPDDTHGAVNDLTKHQLNDLVEYLRSL